MRIAAQPAAQPVWPPLTPQPTSAARSTHLQTAPAPQYLGATAGPTLQIRHTRFGRINLAQLTAGDIAFQYVPRPQEFRQKWIGVGNVLSNFWRPRYRSDPGVMHAFLVVSADPANRRIHAVDAAGGNFTDVTEVDVDFNTGERVPPGAQYFFYRAKNPSLRQNIITTALNWATPGLHNFSIKHAVASPFRSFKPTMHSWQCAANFYPQAGRKGPLIDPQTGQVYRMMCSEFVVTVLVAATLLAWRAARPDLDERYILQGLYDGDMGHALAVDPRGMTPSLLQRQLERCPGVDALGFIDAYSA